MVDTKFPDLPAATALADADVVPFTADPATTALTKKITAANLKIAMTSRRGLFGYVTGVDYGTEGLGTGGSQLLLANRLYAVPNYYEKGATFDAIAVDVSTVAGHASMGIRFGIYQHIPAIAGSPLLLDAGVLTGLTAAAVSRLTLSPVFTAPYSGWYWMALIANANGQAGALPTLRGAAVSTIGATNNLMGFTGTTWTSAATALGVYNDQSVPDWTTYVFPSVFPAITRAGSGINMPIVCLRKA